MASLSETISYWRKTPFDWKTGNCLISIADHFISLGYSDRAAAWREQITNADDAARAVKAADGMAAIFANNGFKAVRGGVAGDVVICEFDGAEIGGLRGDLDAYFRLETGVSTVDLRHIERHIMSVWRIV